MLSSLYRSSAPSSARRSCFALEMRASSTRPITWVVITAAINPMMMTTTMISIRVKPRCLEMRPGVILDTWLDEQAPIIAKDSMQPVTADTYRARLLRSLNCDGWYGFALLESLVLLLLPLAGDDALRELLRYERYVIRDGQLWRLLTAHLV